MQPNTLPNKDTQPQGMAEQQQLGKKLFKIFERAVGGLNHTHIGYSPEHDGLLDPFIDEALALINSEGDKRVREFAEKLDAELNRCFVVGGHRFNKDIYRMTKQILDVELAALTQSGGTDEHR